VCVCVCRTPTSLPFEPPSEWVCVCVCFSCLCHCPLSCVLRCVGVGVSVGVDKGECEGEGEDEIVDEVFGMVVVVGAWCFTTALQLVVGAWLLCNCPLSRAPRCVGVCARARVRVRAHALACARVPHATFTAAFAPRSEVWMWV